METAVRGGGGEPLQPPAEPLRLLHADDELVAIDKPPGLLVHRSTLDAHEDRHP